jgi:hypothetical protein
MQNIKIFSFILFFLLTCFAVYSQPVKVHPDNFRYFTDGSGKAIVFTGSHTWMRKPIKKQWMPDGWNLQKFSKYLDFLQYWNHNYTRLWMWEQPGDVDIWLKEKDGKYDLSKLNPAYFDLVRSFVSEAKSRGIYLGVMLFQGWSGTCDASREDWPRHAMNKLNNVNGIDGDPKGIGYGNKVHSLDNKEIIKFHEAYVRKMIDVLNDFDNIIWEIGNETIESSIPWKAHLVKFIRDYESRKPKQHLILDGTGNGVGNSSIWITGADTFSPCIVTKWGSLSDPYIGNPPIPSDSLGKPIVLDNDHLGNHFLRYTALNQRNWTFKSFTRGNHPIHMDCYDVMWDGAEPIANHPIKNVATNPHYDPQRKSLGDVQRFAKKMDLAKMTPTMDSLICSTTFCLVNKGKEYLVYQPNPNGDIRLSLPAGSYEAEYFDVIDNSFNKISFKWKGGIKYFSKPSHVKEDWLLYAKARK